MFDICPFVMIQQNNRDTALRRVATTFLLDQKSSQKIKFAVMQINERLSEVGLKLAFAGQTLKQQTDRKNDSFICLTATFGSTS